MLLFEVSGLQFVSTINLFYIHHVYDLWVAGLQLEETSPVKKQQVFLKTDRGR